MHLPLWRHVPEQLLASPPSHRLLDRAHVKDAVMQVLENLRVGPARQERFIGVDAVPRQQRSAGLRNVLLDVGQQIRRGGGRGRGGRENGGCQSRTAVGVDAPLGHGVEGRFGVVDDGLEAVGLEELELRVGDEAADLEDLVGFRVEARHLWEGRPLLAS